MSAALDRMRADGAGPAALAAFARRLEQLEAGPDAGLLPGDELEPIDAPPRLDGPARGDARSTASS